MDALTDCEAEAGLVSTPRAPGNELKSSTSRERGAKAKTLLVADLFCGAGGSSTGCRKALAALGYKMKLVCVNHWPVAIETHRRNHPEARHYCVNLDAARPVELVPEGYLDLLMASPECTHHSRARGGKPMNDQSRMSAWHVVRWCTDLRIKHVIIENVLEFEEWGPLDLRTARPLKTRKGQFFLAFVKAMEALGYKYQWKAINAADHGEATTRVRLYMMFWLGKRTIPWPEPSHSRTGSADLFGRRKKWRAAREIINWNHQGRSIFGRKKHLAPKTLERTLAGARKFGWPLPFIFALLHALRDSLLQYMEIAETFLAEPLPTDAKAKRKALKRQKQESRYLEYARKRLPEVTAEIANPIPAGKGDAATTMMVVLRQHADGRSVDAPVPTLTGGANHVAIATPVAEPFVCGNRENNTGQSVDGPIPTNTTATGGGLFLAQPDIQQASFVLSQASGGAPRSVGEPMPTAVGAGVIRMVGRSVWLPARPSRSS